MVTDYAVGQDGRVYETAGAKRIKRTLALIAQFYSLKF